MDVLQLRYLVAVVDAGSLSRAAEVLRISQPALSQRMNQLERELGVQLLDRGPRGVRPTRAGTDFYRDAHRLVRQFDELAASAAAEHPVRGLVAVGLPSGAAVHLAAPLFGWAREHVPGVRLELFESMSGYVDELFDHGRTDLAIRYVDPLDPAARAVAAGTGRAGEALLYDEELLLVGDPPEPTRDPDRVTLAELAAIPVVAPGTRSSLRQQLERAMRREERTLRVVADVESLSTMLRIARSGGACAVVPASTAADSAADGLAVRRTDPALRRTAVLRTAATTSAPHDAVAAVRSGVTTLTRELARSGRWPGIELREDPS
ncbi:LysR family transcriptional regulator [Nocardioides sp. AX2bis]|uniref:LysR family transcriptional regulator n=1 Tax=Nocardioides sp. AX2bis TaxID=2653157 RepID=UPI0012F0D2F8|nr:LysR family transcriptional regulator [Nocardioides sp. AX2bis]VXB27981.1 LysR family transcriptional regulator [Nocardioides sp. AX2bis]